MLSQMSHVRPLPPISFRSLLILPSHQRLILPCGHVPLGFPNQTPIRIFLLLHSCIFSARTHRKNIFSKLSSLWKSCFFFFCLTITRHGAKQTEKMSSSPLSKVKPELLEHIQSGVWQVISMRVPGGSDVTVKWYKQRWRRGQWPFATPPLDWYTDYFDWSN